MRITLRSLLVLLVLSVAPTVHASPLFELIGGFGGQGALQARAAGPSAASSYFNPGLLTDAPVGLTFGALVLNTGIGVQVDARPAGSAVPDGLVNAGHADGSRFSTYPIATDLLQNGRATDPLNPGLPSRPRQRAGSGHETTSYEAIGLVVKLFEDRLAVGFYGLLPNKNFTTFVSHYVDEREQYFTNSLHPELYGDRMMAISVAFAAGVKVTDSLSLGLGATIGIHAGANAPVYVADAGKLQDLQLNTDIAAKVKLVPHAGLSWRPGKRWHLTGTVHAPQQFDVRANFKFLLATGVEQSGSGLGFTYNFQPWQAGAGVGFDFYKQGDLTLTATASTLYGRWSKYIDRPAERPKGAYEWGDTLSAAGGVRVQKGTFGFALDGQYKPTPVPAQTGRTNYVDNDRVGLTVAVEYGFTWKKTTLKLGGQLQGFRMLERHQTKIKTPTYPDGQDRHPQLVVDEVPDDSVLGDTPVAGREGLQSNNPGFPGFSSAGWLSSGGIYFSATL